VSRDLPDITAAGEAGRDVIGVVVDARSTAGDDVSVPVGGGGALGVVVGSRAWPTHGGRKSNE